MYKIMSMWLNIIGRNHLSYGKVYRIFSPMILNYMYDRKALPTALDMVSSNNIKPHNHFFTL